MQGSHFCRRPVPRIGIDAVLLHEQVTGLWDDLVNAARTSRRHLELAAKGIDADWNDIKHNLLERDRIDSTRFDSPLRQAEDAVVIDNTLLSEDEQLDLALRFALERGAKM